MSSDTEEIPQSRAGDLPPVQIPSEFNPESDTSDSDYEADSDSSNPSTPVTPGTPITPLSHLAESVSSFDFSDIAGTPTSSFSIPAKRTYKKKIHPGRFAEGVKAKRTLFQTPSRKAKKVTLSRSSPFLDDVRFPRPPVVNNIKLKEGEKVVSKPAFLPHGAEIMNMDILNQVFSLLRCPVCNCSRIVLHKLPFSDGLHSYFVLHFTICHVVTAKFSSSLNIGETPQDAVNNPKMLAPRERQSDVSTRALLDVHVTSISWQDFLFTCALMALPVPGQNLNKRALDTLITASAYVSDKSMSLAAADVRKRLDTQPSNIPGAFTCAVSFDGTWHKRGHHSNQCFGVAIDSEFGKVIDYQLYQKVCVKCTQWPRERQNSQPEEYAEFHEQHKDCCPANFTKSSQAMEGEAAKVIWNRSVQKNNLVYKSYIGDGDSSSFKKVEDSKPYGDLEVVRKEECLGHLQKRLKKNLKKKSPNFKKIGPTRAERIGQLYALVVVQNRGRSPEIIQSALWDILDHLVENHTHCPLRKDSWCNYNMAITQNTTDSSIPIPQLRKPYLTQDELMRAKEVFEIFASLRTCSAVTMGKTQNSNESLHSVIWHNSPKTKYDRQKSMVASTSHAVSTFNEGSMALSAVLQALSIPASYSTFLHLTQRDIDRNHKRDRAILATQKRRRRQLDARKEAAESSRMRREKGSTYESEQFGVEGKDNDICAECGMEECPIDRKRKKEDWVGCDLCKDMFHGRCVGVANVKKLGDDPFFCSICLEIVS